jgi:hypothetical protein
MVKDAEEFASEDDAQRKRIETRNSPSSFGVELQTHFVNTGGLGGKPRLSVLHSRRWPTTSTHTALTHQLRISKRNSPKSRLSSTPSPLRSTRAALLLQVSPAVQEAKTSMFTASCDPLSTAFLLLKVGMGPGGVAVPATLSIRYRQHTKDSGTGGRDPSPYISYHLCW